MLAVKECHVLGSSGEQQRAVCRYYIISRRLTARPVRWAGDEVLFLSPKRSEVMPAHGKCTEEVRDAANDPCQHSFVFDTINLTQPFSRCTFCHILQDENACSPLATRWPLNDSRRPCRNEVNNAATSPWSAELLSWFTICIRIRIRMSRPYRLRWSLYETHSTFSWHAMVDFSAIVAICEAQQSDDMQKCRRAGTTSDQRKAGSGRQLPRLEAHRRLCRTPSHRLPTKQKS